MAEFLIGSATDAMYNGGSEVFPLLQVTADGPDAQVSQVSPAPGGDQDMYEMIAERVAERGMTVRQVAATFGTAGTYKEMV